MFFEIEIYSPRLRDHCAKSVTDISTFLFQWYCRKFAAIWNYLHGGRASVRPESPRFEF